MRLSNCVVFDPVQNGSLQIDHHRTATELSLGSKVTHRWVGDDRQSQYVSKTKSCVCVCLPSDNLQPVLLVYVYFLALIRFKTSVFCCIYNINPLDFPHLICSVSSAHVFLFGFNINGFHLCPVIDPAHTWLIFIIYLKAVLVSHLGLQSSCSCPLWFCPGSACWNQLKLFLDMT